MKLSFLTCRKGSAWDCGMRWNRGAAAQTARGRAPSQLRAGAAVTNACHCVLCTRVPSCERPFSSQHLWWLRFPVSSGAGDEMPSVNPDTGHPASDVFCRSACQTQGPTAWQTHEGAPCHQDLLLARRVLPMSVHLSLGSFTSRPWGGPTPRLLEGGRAWSPGLSRVVQGPRSPLVSPGALVLPHPPAVPAPLTFRRGLLEQTGPSGRSAHALGVHCPRLPAACQARGSLTQTILLTAWRPTRAVDAAT